MRSDRRQRMILAVTTLAAACCSLAASQTGPAVPPDGSLLKEAEGRLIRDNGRWLFEVQTPGIVPGKGKALDLLPSATLEALVADAAQRPEGRYRLSGQVETYHGRTYLFVTSFMPLTAGEADSNSVGTPLARQDPNPAPGKGDPLAIPEQIQKQLADYQAARQRSAKGTTTAPASLLVLLDQVGLLVQDQQRAFFVKDGLGQNATPGVFEVLPSATLESMERLQLQVPEPVRFRVGGLVTEYQGQSYLLLHRAVREYDYGNFGR